MRRLTRTGHVVSYDSAHVGRLPGETNRMLADRVLLHWRRMDGDAVAECGDDFLIVEWLRAIIAARMRTVMGGVTLDTATRSDGPIMFDAIVPAPR